MVNRRERGIMDEQPEKRQMARSDQDDQRHVRLALVNAADRAAQYVNDPYFRQSIHVLAQLLVPMVQGIASHGEKRLDEMAEMIERIRKAPLESLREMGYSPQQEDEEAWRESHQSHNDARQAEGWPS